MFADTAFARPLARGETLYCCGQYGPLWEVASGLVLLTCSSASGRVPCGLARPGDLLGAEIIWGAAYAVTASALTPALVRHAPALSAQQDIAILGRAYSTLQQRHAEVLALRCGTAQERIGRAFELFGDAQLSVHGHAPAGARIAGRDLARLLDLTEETVCRELRRWRMRQPGQPAPVYAAPLAA